MARKTLCFGKAFKRKCEYCLICKKKSLETYNACRKEVLSSLNNPNYKDNDEIVRMTLDDVDWKFYCEKIIKRNPKTQRRYQHFIIAAKRGRKNKIVDDSFSAVMCKKAEKK